MNNKIEELEAKIPALPSPAKSIDHIASEKMGTPDAKS